MPRQDDRGDPREMKLPSALEKVLAFKDVRAQEVGMTTEELEKLNMPESKPCSHITKTESFTSWGNICCNLVLL